MPPAGLEPKILASDRPQTHALDGAATGIGENISVLLNKYRLNIEENNWPVKWFNHNVMPRVAGM
jgi:hypothetical protein